MQLLSAITDCNFDLKLTCQKAVQLHVTLLILTPDMDVQHALRLRVLYNPSNAVHLCGLRVLTRRPTLVTGNPVRIPKSQGVPTST